MAAIVPERKKGICWFMRGRASSCYLPRSCAAQQKGKGTKWIDVPVNVERGNIKQRQYFTHTLVEMEYFIPRNDDVQ